MKVNELPDRPITRKQIKETMVDYFATKEYLDEYQQRKPIRKIAMEFKDWMSPHGILRYIREEQPDIYNTVYKRKA